MNKRGLDGLSEKQQTARLKFRLILVWSAIALCGLFLFALCGSSTGSSLSVVPEAPREGDPVIVKYTLKNPGVHESPVEYQFYINGRLVQSGSLLLEPLSSARYQFSNLKAPETGKQVNFQLITKTPRGEQVKLASSPSYPPQIFSSFTSFASFSTSVMSFMTSAPYYDETFGARQGLNVGLVCSISLIILLIFLELSEPVVQESQIRSLISLRLRFSTVTWILLIIFVNMVFTRIVMILN